MISVEQALAQILEKINPVQTEQISIVQALGRVISEDVISRVTQPPIAVSAMDGYAVKAEDVKNAPTKLKIVGEAPAGAAYEGEMRSGETVRIFTGGPVPNGADSIVMQENTKGPEESEIIICESVDKGRFVRPAGLDFEEGKILIEKGKTLTARDIALVAAMNIPWLAVYRKPVVAVLATGDEIVMPGDPLGANQIISSNSLGLAATIETLGAEIRLLGIATDDAESLRRMAAGAAGADLLVTTGGASVGDHDLIQKVLGDVGLRVDFWRIAMRPGKPLVFGQINGIPMLGLPGNPVSTMVCALVYLVPALDKLMGISKQLPARPSEARLATPLPANDKRQDYLRARLAISEDGALLACPFEKQDSSMLSLLARSDALVIRPPLAPAAPAGEMVPLLSFPKSRTQL